MSKDKLEAALNRLGKWRAVFASWQLGTRTKTDPECQAVRDHRELTIMMRAELSALTSLLLEKNVFTLEEYGEKLTDEAEELSSTYQKVFPGFKAVDYGIVINAAIAKDTMKGWKP